MPSGKSHAYTTVILTGASVVVCEYYGFSQWHSAGVLSGVLLSPDLDIDAGNISNQIIRSIPVVGVPLERAWSVYWWLYAELTLHRGILSHSFVLGTAIRAFCALWWLWLIPTSHFYWSWFWGLAVSDAVHILMDAGTELAAGIRRVWRKIKTRHSVAG